jgi:hypothetical protein
MARFVPKPIQTAVEFVIPLVEGREKVQKREKSRESFE